MDSSTSASRCDDIDVLLVTANVGSLFEDVCIIILKVFSWWNSFIIWYFTLASTPSPSLAGSVSTKSRRTTAKIFGTTFAGSGRKNIWKINGICSRIHKKFMRSPPNVKFWIYTYLHGWRFQFRWALYGNYLQWIQTLKSIIAKKYHSILSY